MAKVSRGNLDRLDRIYTGRKSHEMLGTLALTVPQKTSGNRAQMFSASHLPQCVMLEKPESPRIFTGYELPYGKYTSSKHIADRDFKILAVISKYSGPLARHKYLYLVVDDKGEHDLIEMNHFEALAEGMGYIRPMTHTDNLIPEQFIPKGTILQQSANHDANGNYRFGLNANVAYVSVPETVEDGIWCSQSFADRASFFFVEKVDILLNNNDILLNLYGDRDVYKSFPDIGESVNDGILCAKRRVNYSNAASELTNRALCEIATTDSVYQGGGYVADVEIFINDPSELENMEHRTQLLRYYAIQEAYYAQIRDIVGPIVKKNLPRTYRLRHLYQRAVDFFETKSNPDGYKWSGPNGPFEFGYLRITRIEKTGLKHGYKLTNRYGGKGVISKILPDYLMPVDERGVRADVVLSPSGIPARANIGQSYEHELNFISDRILDRMKVMKTMDEKFAFLTRFLKDVSEEYGGAFEEWLKKQVFPSKQRTMLEIEQHGIFLHQGPFFDNITYEGMKNLYRKYKIEPGKVRMRRRFTEGVQRYRADLAQASQEAFVLVGEQEEIPTTTVFDLYDNEDSGEFINSPFIYGLDASGDIQMMMKEGNETIVVPKRLYPNTTRILREKDGTLVREFTTEQPVIIAQEYIMVLKHTPESKFSARSLGTINTMGVPSKSGRSEHDTPYSTTPIKFGDMEFFNALIRVDPNKLHRFTAGHSTNPAMRVDLARMLLNEDPLELHDLPIQDHEIVSDVPALLLSAYLYSIGVELADE